MNGRQTKKAEAGVPRRFGELPLEEVERKLRALRELREREGSLWTLDESILAGVFIADLEAARKRKLRERRAAEGSPVESDDG